MSKQVIKRAMNLYSDLEQKKYHLRTDFFSVSLTTGKEMALYDIILPILKNDSFTDSFKLFVIFLSLKSIKRQIEIAGRAQSERRLIKITQNFYRRFNKEDEKYINETASHYSEAHKKEMENLVHAVYPLYSPRPWLKRPWTYEPGDNFSSPPPPLEEAEGRPIIYTPQCVEKVLNVSIEKLKRYIDNRSFHSIRVRLKGEETAIYETDPDLCYRDGIEMVLNTPWKGRRYYRQECLTDQPQPPYLSSWGRFFSYSKTQKTEAAQALIDVLEARRDGTAPPEITQKQWAVLNEPQSRLGNTVKNIGWVIRLKTTSLDIRHAVKQNLPGTLSDIVMGYYG